MQANARNLVFGLGWAVVAITVWSGSLVMLRLGVTTSLNAYDLTALRFGVAAVLLAPVAWRRRGSVARVGGPAMVALVATFGAPYVLLIALASRTAPAAAAGALNPGVMAIVSLVLGRVVFGDRIGGIRLAGMAMTGAGIVVFGTAGGAIAPGHLILIGTGVMWASYSLIVRRHAVAALDATAIVALGSALAFLPLYLTVLPRQIGAAPLFDVLLQAGFQGVGVSVVAIYAFNRSAELLGPVAGASLPALIPVVTLALGLLVLGEAAPGGQVLSAGLITLGLVLILVGRPVLRRLSGADRPGCVQAPGCRES